MRWKNTCGCVGAADAPQLLNGKKCRESEVKEPSMVFVEQSVGTLCGSPAAARNPAWEINHILWKFLTSPDQLRVTSVFRIAILVLNKQEEGPFISNSFQTTRMFFLCVSQIAFPTELWRGHYTAHTHWCTLSSPGPMAASPWLQASCVTAQSWEIKYGSMSVCSV